MLKLLSKFSFGQHILREFCQVESLLFENNQSNSSFQPNYFSSFLLALSRETDLQKMLLRRHPLHLI